MAGNAVTHKLIDLLEGEITRVSNVSMRYADCSFQKNEEQVQRLFAE